MDLFQWGLLGQTMIRAETLAVDILGYDPPPMFPNTLYQSLIVSRLPSHSGSCYVYFYWDEVDEIRQIALFDKYFWQHIEDYNWARI